MNYARIVRTPKWQLAIINKVFPLLTFIKEDFINAFGEKIQNKKALILIALACYSLVFILAGFAWAIVDYKLIGK